MRKALLYAVQHCAKRFASFRDDDPIPPATAVLMPAHCNRIHRFLECDLTVVVKVDVDADCDANHILIGRSSARLGARTHAAKLQRCAASAGIPGGVRSSIVLRTGAAFEPQGPRTESFERHRYVAQFTD